MLTKLEAEKIAAEKFLELKGQDYLEKYRGKLYVSSGENADIVFVNFNVGSISVKKPGEIVVDETKEWEESIIMHVNKITGTCNIV